jgi:hypothetical protein
MMDLNATVVLSGVLMRELLRAADHCLYASKSRGRDRSTCLSPASAFRLARAGAPGGKYGFN